VLVERTIDRYRVHINQLHHPIAVGPGGLHVEGHVDLARDGQIL